MESLRASGIDAVVTVVSVTASSLDSRLSRAIGKSCRNRVHESKHAVSHSSDICGTCTANSEMAVSLLY